MMLNKGLSRFQLRGPIRTSEAIRKFQLLGTCEIVISNLITRLNVSAIKHSYNKFLTVISNIIFFFQLMFVRWFLYLPR